MLGEIGTVWLLLAFVVIARLVTPKSKIRELERMEIEQGLKDGSIERRQDMEYITTVHKGKGYIARVHKPILTEEERARRIKEVEKALIEFAKATYKRS